MIVSETSAEQYRQQQEANVSARGRMKALRKLTGRSSIAFNSIDRNNGNHKKEYLTSFKISHCRNCFMMMDKASS